MDTAAGEGLRRRRSGGREAHARSTLPQQRPWAQPRMRYGPTEIVSADELESIHLGSLRVLSEIGMDFLDPDAREVLRAAGAETTPDTLRVRNPAYDIQLGGDWVAFGTVGSPPNVADLDRGRRIGNRVDYQNLLRLAQSLNAIHFLSGYPVEPVDLHHGVRHLWASYDALTLMDKAVHCYSLGRQRNIDVLEMVRIARGVDQATIDREPSVFTVVNSSSPLRLDAPMLQGIMEFAAHSQVVCITPFTLAGAMAPVTLAGALAEQNAEALAGMVLP